MTTDEFFNQWNNKACNPDGAYGNQCVDVADEYSKDVVGVNLPPVRGAVDLWTNYPKTFYDRVENTADNFPQKGDIVIWGNKVGEFGHVDIAVSGDKNHFTGFEQNWPSQGYLDKDGNFIGTGVCHYQAHDYFGVLGWLHPKSKTQPAPTPVEPAPAQQIPLDLAILNIYRALCGVDPSKDEIVAKMKEFNSGKPLSSIIEDIIRGDSRYKARWGTQQQPILQNPPLVLVPTGELFKELLNRMVGK